MQIWHWLPTPSLRLSYMEVHHWQYLIAEYIEQNKLISIIIEHRIGHMARREVNEESGNQETIRSVATELLWIMDPLSLFEHNWYFCTRLATNLKKVERGHNLKIHNHSALGCVISDVFEIAKHPVVCEGNKWMAVFVAEQLFISQSTWVEMHSRIHHTFNCCIA